MLIRAMVLLLRIWQLVSVVSIGAKMYSGAPE